jgi:Ala-tRNA(Pro) deacylase
MTIAGTVLTSLQSRGIPYDVVAHPRTYSSKTSAEAAHIPPDRLAKAVVLMDQGGYVMVVIPSNRHVEIATLSRKLGRNLTLADESRIAPVFKDCHLGAIPPIGPAYGMETIVDDGLVGQPEIYFEAGDHEELIRVSGKQFLSLLKEARHGQFCH